MARDERSVRDPRLRGDAPADPGRAGDSALDALARAVADGRSARGGTPADAILEWQGLGYNRRAVSLHRAARIVARARLAGRPHRTSRRRPLHRRGGRELRLRARSPSGRHERPSACRSEQARRSTASAPRRSSISGRRCVSPASPAAACARSPAAARLAAAATSRSGSSRRSRGRSANGARRRFARSPPADAPPTRTPSPPSPATGSSRSAPTAPRHSRAEPR